MKYFFALLSALFLTGANAYSVLPQDGLWSVDSERSLAIGRAFNLETGGALTVVTFYNYNASGGPTFYVGAAGLTANNTLTVGLSEPRGGTCLGCAATSGSLLSAPGTALFEFTSSTTGFVTLPRENRKAISKGYVGFEASPNGLLGGWVFNYLTTATGYTFADYALLTITAAGTTTGSGLVFNSAGTIVCEQQVSGSLSGFVLCLVYLSSSSPTSDKQIITRWYGNHMDGLWNYTGISSIQRLYTARRINSFNGDFYSVKRDAERPTDEAINALRAAMTHAVATTQRPE